VPNLVRYKHNGITSNGILTTIGDKKVVAQVCGSFYESWTTNGSFHALGDVELLSPCTPTKVVGVGVNYYSMATSLGIDVPSKPLFFIKPASGVTGPDATIVLPDLSQRVDYEIELAVVIKKRGHHIQPGEAFDHILGYTCANDVTAVDLIEAGSPWTLAKGFDTFTPLGPWIVTDISPERLYMEAYLNGKMTQQGSTRDMIFKIPQLIAHISKIMTLEAGDVLLSGTIPGKGTLSSGDVIGMTISDIGSLRNKVVRA